ncbi:MAG: HlyD family efflux transporter periplasmic adaptor subunit [Planctomycetota bacterium]|nr:HlyD family efflux transporter periplasmic adaptor subunit [Planctomycetota bacterium]
MPWIEVKVPARSAGVLAALNMREGQVVTRRALVAELDRTTEEVELGRSQEELEQVKEQAENEIPTRLAKKVLEIARLDLSRAQEARKTLKQSISQAELDHLELDVARGELALEMALHQQRLAHIQMKIKAREVSLAEIALQKRAINAPQKGVIAVINYQQGEWVELGQSLCRLLVLDRVRVETLLPADVATPQMTGREVEFVALESAGVRTSHPGVVVFVSPEQDPVNGKVRVWVEVRNAEGRLRPGGRGHVKLLRSERERDDATRSTLRSRTR